MKRSRVSRPRAAAPRSEQTVGGFDASAMLVSSVLLLAAMLLADNLVWT